MQPKQQTTWNEALISKLVTIIVAIDVNKVRFVFGSVFKLDSSLKNSLLHNKRFLKQKNKKNYFILTYLLYLSETDIIYYFK